MKKISLNFMRIQFVLPAIVVCMIGTRAARANYNADPFKDSASVTGRWDMTLYIDGKEYPSWLDVQISGKILVGEYVGIVGNARPVSRVNFKDRKISFSVPPQHEEGDNDLLFEGELKSDSLTGTLKSASGKTYKWSGVRAPSLRRNTEPVWQAPVQLFNGKDLTGWHALGENQWIAKDGVLQSPKSGSNLVTDATFTDFKLNIEFRYPEGSNSGVYLRGRYEVQIEASHGDEEPYKGVFSAVYGFIAPSEVAAKGPGEWQSYDITLTGRMVTVVANGKTVICNREIPGITGGALNSKEGEHGPLMLQGDHGPIEYRNITIAPAK